MMIKSYIKSRSIREQLLIFLLFVILIIVVLYNLLFIPVANNLNNLHGEIENQEELLLYLETVAPTVLSNAANDGSTNNILQEYQVLSVLIEATMQDFEVSDGVTNLNIRSSNEVEVTFSQLNFIDLLSWLSFVNGEYGLVLVEFSWRALPEPGAISGSLLIGGTE